MYESWHPQHRFIRNSIIARKIVSCCMLLSLFILGTCQMSLNQWSSLFWKAVSAKMMKVLLCSITAGKLRVKYVPKQVQSREQEQGKDRNSDWWGRELDHLFQSCCSVDSTAHEALCLAKNAHGPRLSYFWFWIGTVTIDLSSSTTHFVPSSSWWVILEWVVWLMYLRPGLLLKGT